MSDRAEQNLRCKGACRVNLGCSKHNETIHQKLICGNFGLIFGLTCGLTFGLILGLTFGLITGVAHTRYIIQSQTNFRKT